jgi:UDP-glucose 4-epimerase
VSRVLVTGGAGAIGSNLVTALLARGDEVTVLDDLSSGRAELVPEGARLLRGSVAEGDALDEAFAARPERIFHLAALFANQNSVEHPDRDLLVNGLGTIRVLERAARLEGARVLNVSSSCVYGGAIEVMHEDLVGAELDTPYAVTKLLGEQYAGFWARHHRLHVVSVRLFNVYGPGEHPGRYRNVIPNFLATAMRGEPLVITGTGAETRDFTFVADTVRGMVAALDSDRAAPGDVFNLASGRETSILDLAQAVNEITGNAAPIEFVARRSWDQVSRRLGDITRAREVLGFEPMVGLEEGLARAHAWLRDALTG